MKSIKKYIINQFVPLRSTHLTNTADLRYNWGYCENYYEDFSLSLIRFNKNQHRTYLPPKNLFKKLFLNYLSNPSMSSHFFKAQWVLSEYLTTGWKYPVQAVWNWRMRWWEIHPGYLRGLIYNLLDVTEWDAWYQPIKNKLVDKKTTFESPSDIYNYFSGCHHISTHVVNYFNKPLLTICVHVTENNDSIKLHEEIFHQNTQKINIVGEDQIINRIKIEVNSWPDSYIKNQIIYNSNSFPSLTITNFNKDNFYAGLYLFGTNVKEFNQLGLIYRNNK